MCPDILSPAIIDEHTFAHALVTLEETRSPDHSCFSSDLPTAYKLARVVDLIQPYAESNSRRRNVGVEVKCMDETLPVYGLRMTDRRRPLCVGTVYSPAFADHVWPVPSAATKARVYFLCMAYVIVDHIECVQLAQGDINSKDPRGYTTLMHASTLGYTNIVSLLTAQKANVNLKCNSPFGSTALMMACENNRVDCARLLLAVDEIEVNATDNKKNTALMQASRKGNIDCVQLLVQCKGID
ncbi:unnamed protein product [Sphagnum balticum]